MDTAVSPKTDEVEDLNEGLAEEARVIKGKPEVYQPTKEEIDDHYRTHFPYRSWCRCCVSGIKKAAPHRQANETGKTKDKPVVAIDCKGKARKNKSVEEN